MLILSIIGMLLFTGFKVADRSLSIKSKDGLNKITLSLNENGELYYQVTRRGKIIISSDFEAYWLL